MIIFRGKREKSKRKREKIGKNDTILYQFVAAAASKMLKGGGEGRGGSGMADGSSEQIG